MFARVASSTPGVGYLAVYVTLRDLPADPADLAVVVGWRTPVQGKEREIPPFYVLAVTGLLASEVTRQDYDETVVSENRNALQTALDQDPDDRALFSPGVTYRVAATWRAAWLKQDARPPAAMINHGQATPTNCASARATTAAAAKASGTIGASIPYRCLPLSEMT